MGHGCSTVIFQVLNLKSNEKCLFTFFNLNTPARYTRLSVHPRLESHKNNLIFHDIMAQWPHFWCTCTAQMHTNLPYTPHRQRKTRQSKNSLLAHDQTMLYLFFYRILLTYILLGGFFLFHCI